MRKNLLFIFLTYFVSGHSGARRYGRTTFTTGRAAFHRTIENEVLSNTKRLEWIAPSGTSSFSLRKPPSEVRNLRSSFPFTTSTTENIQPPRSQTTTSEPVLVFPDDSGGYVDPTRKETSRPPLAEPTHRVVTVEEDTEDPNRNVFQAPRKECPPGSKLDDFGSCKKEA